MTSCRGFHDLHEEILERVWNESEEGVASDRRLRDELAGLADAEAVATEVLGLVGEGLLDDDGGTLALTPAGREAARHVVRAHRLAARLLNDLLELPPSVTEGHACRLEHAISEALADRLCTLLGHPPVAPDGKPIPRGACCLAATAETAPAVFPMDRLELGATGRIVFLHPARAGRLDAMLSLGLAPGTDVRLKQRSPALVVEAGETTLAMEPEMARDIFVKPAG